MFRSHRTTIREHVVPIPKLPLITYWYVTLWLCGSMFQQNHSVTYKYVISGNFGIGTTCSLMMVRWDRNMLE